MKVKVFKFLGGIYVMLWSIFNYYISHGYFENDNVFSTLLKVEVLARNMDGLN